MESSLLETYVGALAICHWCDSGRDKLSLHWQLSSHLLLSSSLFIFKFPRRSFYELLATCGLPMNTGNCQWTKERPGPSASKPAGWAAAQSSSPHGVSFEAAKLKLVPVAFQASRSFQYISFLLKYIKTHTHL